MSQVAHRALALDLLVGLMKKPLVFPTKPVMVAYRIRNKSSRHGSLKGIDPIINFCLEVTFSANPMGYAAVVNWCVGKL